MELPTLPVRPKAETRAVSDILEDAKRGRLRIPRFQTGLRWGPRHVEELFDSIVRGFPIGGLLLWKRPAEADQLAFGPFQVAADKLPDSYHIVDGQQRITALVGALLHPDSEPIGDNYSLWVDLTTGDFRVQKKERPPDTWLPANLLGDRERLQHWARGVDLGEATGALVDRAFVLEEKIIRYTIPVYVVEDASAEALRLIFSRINSSGEPLSEAQVFEAMFGSEMGPKPLEQMALRLHEQTGFGRLPTSWLLRCVKAVGTLDPKSSFDEHRCPGPDLIARTGAALRRAIVFLQDRACFWHASVLPYRFPLLILARFFDLHLQPHPRSLALLTRWLWRGALSGQHGDSSHAAVWNHLRDLGQDEHDAVQRLLGRSDKTCTLPDPLRAWASNAAATRLYVVLMLSADPCRPSTGEPWERETLLSLLSQHSLGQLFRRPLDMPSRPIAAHVLLPPRVSRGLAGAAPEVLHSLFIDEDAAEALRAGETEAFAQRRARLLEAAMDRMVRRLAAPGDCDRPPISAILAAG